MDPRCIQAVRAAAGGRQISDAKIKTLEDAISTRMRDLARQDPPRWRSLTRDQQMAEAAKAAMDSVVAEARLKEYRGTLQVLRTAETDARIQQAMAHGGLNRSRGLVRDIEQTAQYIDAVRNDAISGLGDLIDAAATRDGAGAARNLGMRIFDLDNPVMTRDVVREVFGQADGRTGNAAAKAAARAWLDTIEGLRLRFNAAGGNVGKLRDVGYLPNLWETARVARETAESFADFLLPRTDRSAYVKEDGRFMTDAEIRDMLRAAHATLASDGLNQSEPGAFRGTGARSNRGSQHRVIHLRDGDAWMEAMDRYGEGSLYDAMMGHVGGISRDIGLTERYGPNPEQQFRAQNDLAERADGAGTLQNRSVGNTPRAYWSLVNGAASTPENRIAAMVGENARNIQTAAKLGGAVLSSVTDMATIATTLHFNRLPYFDMLSNIKKQLNPEVRSFLRAHGVIGETLVSTLNRWTGDHMTHNLTGRVAGSVMKLSLMNAWTDGLRNAFSMTMMHGLSRMAKKSWGQLDEWDRYLLQRKGITEQEWAIVQKAEPTVHDGYAMLTPEAIRAVSDADLEGAAPAGFQRIRDSIAAQTAELTQRNQQEAAWIKGRIEKFDAARDGMNRVVKDLLARKLKATEKATEPLLQRMQLLEAQRAQAQLQANIEAEYNKLFTQQDIREFSAGLKEAAAEVTRAEKGAARSAESSGKALGRRLASSEARVREAQRQFDRTGDGERLLIRQEVEAANQERAQAQNDIEIVLKATPEAERQALRDAIADVAQIRSSANAGANTARRLGERYGEAKGRLERRMQEIESRITQMDRDAHAEANKAGRQAQVKAAEMGKELADFIKRSQDRQQRRAAVIQRVQAGEGLAVLAEAQRLRDQVATKMLAYTLDEAQFAVVNPDLATRAIVTGGGMPAGTVRGETMRAAAQFKSFPIAMLTRHWRRALETPQGLEGAPTGFGASSRAGAAVNRAAVLAGLNLSLMMLGAVVLQNKAIVQGRDPYDMTDPKFWGRAVAQGGGAGYLGDLLFKDPSESRMTRAEQTVGSILGPSIGAAAGLAEDVVRSNIWEAAQGKDTHAAAEALRWGNSQMPYASLWWSRAAYERWFLFAAQEALNPGYLSRMRQRAQKDWNQGYWWDPADTLPERAPGFSRAIGEQ
ncbi:hypothetical protein [Pseudorhodoferax sp.]|uniref:hypothetical protein n=1 Tax=Pseudorhodoferax sp. TaxID=1993553 RepID=UPI0039E5E74E